MAFWGTDRRRRVAVRAKHLARRRFPYAPTSKTWETESRSVAVRLLVREPAGQVDDGVGVTEVEDADLVGRGQ
jgi:hypothetical protein